MTSIEPRVMEDDAELPQTAEHPVERVEPMAEEDLELATLAFKGNRLILITPKHRYTINLGLGDNGIEARFVEMRRVMRGYVNEVDLVRSKGYGIDSGEVKD
jgi:hypothetical protein